ncbi:MAG: DUF2252 domain-containing protein [Chamaesiphon sp.]|nr:DUF2252 domain-containing protein [Chamaesiphon sp.]
MENTKNRDAWEIIQTFNSQRDRDTLVQKYVKMRKNTFVFFRGTCHLFYRDLPSDSILNVAPIVWICGDLHLENFGAYKGDNRQIYFGIDDFDEGVLAPCTWDITRLLTSIYLAVDSLSFQQSDAENLVRRYLDVYTTTLSVDSIGEIIEANVNGIVAELLDDLDCRKRSDFLDQRTELIDGYRHLKIDDEKILAISQDRYQGVVRSIELWATSQANPDFFEVLDVGFRVAGTGSLGLDRYLILVTGKGSPDRNYLLDFKQQLGSSLYPYVPIEQPQWKNSATRVIKIQQLVQSAPPALLAAIDFNGGSYSLRELQPTQDKITLKAGKISLAQLEKLIDTMAQVTAFAHLNSSGKLGATAQQDLIDFGNRLDWQKEVLIYTSNYAQQVKQDYRDFCQATQDL